MDKHKVLGPAECSLWKNALVCLQNVKGMTNFMALFDDEYLVFSSGNLDEKSLEGTLDTEVGVCLHQDKYTGDNSLQRGRGELYRLRHEIWADRFGCIHSEFEDPSTWNCLDAIRDLLADEEHSKLCTIQPYPIVVNRLGKVKQIVD